jgi:hypothetical protein
MVPEDDFHAKKLVINKATIAAHKAHKKKDRPQVEKICPRKEH